MSDPFDLERFRLAQSDVIETALAELRAGEKRSHWMWFVFPQIQGLGFSVMAQLYAIGSLEEAKAYLADPVLGPRLIACAQALLAHPDRPAEAIMGPIDSIKLRSSLTLFLAADPHQPALRQTLDVFFGGQADEATLNLLEP